MLTLAKLIGIVIVGMGITLLLSPKAMKQFMAFLGKGRRLYILGILRILFSIILLFSASQCRLVGVVLTLGVLVLIGGIIIFALGLERPKSMLKWWDRRSLVVLRFAGLIALSIGALLLYSI